MQRCARLAQNRDRCRSRGGRNSHTLMRSRETFFFNAWSSSRRERPKAVSDGIDLLRENVAGNVIKRRYLISARRVRSLQAEDIGMGMRERRERLQPSNGRVDRYVVRRYFRPRDLRHGPVLGLTGMVWGWRARISIFTCTQRR